MAYDSYSYSAISTPTVGSQVSISGFGSLAIADFSYLYHLPHEIVFELFTPTTDVTVGNGKKYLIIPPGLTGMELKYVHAAVITAGTTGLTSVQVYNVTDSANMLTTVCSIDSGETGSDTAATAYVIDTAHDDIVTYDRLRIDVTAVASTAPKGLIVTLGFQQPA